MQHGDSQQTSAPAPRPVAEPPAPCQKCLSPATWPHTRIHQPPDQPFRPRPAPRKSLSQWEKASYIQCAAPAPSAAISPRPAHGFSIHVNPHRTSGQAPPGVYCSCSGRILSLRSGTGAKMSITTIGNAADSSRFPSPQTKVTGPALTEMKRQGKLISALTAYDYASARLADEAGIDLLLVGDSLAMVVLGQENTLAVTVDEMLHHTRAVRRAVRRSLVVADMPFGSYHGSIAEGLANAVRFVKEAGAEAVKIEGPRVELVQALTEAEIPVIGHLGLTPQSVHRMGGYRVQARTAETVKQLRSDTLALARAGAGAIVLEGIPREVAADITAALSIPTTGIGAGPDCDGQILVFHDLLNLTFAPPAKFVRRYADAGALIRSAIEHYREDVEHRTFPSDEESYHLPKAARKPADLDYESEDSVVNRDAWDELNSNSKPS